MSDTHAHFAVPSQGGGRFPGKIAELEFHEIDYMSWDAQYALATAAAVFLIHLPAAAIIIMAKLGLGPLFIAALMFPATAK